jgi:hypothetical protein
MHNLHIPDDLYQWAESVAQANNQTVDEVLMTYIRMASSVMPTLPIEEERELIALHHLSDAALWTIAKEVMPSEQAQTMQNLMVQNSAGTISDDDYQRLEALVLRGQQLMLRKSQAMAILSERGHDVKSSNDE